MALKFNYEKHCENGKTIENGKTGWKTGSIDNIKSIEISNITMNQLKTYFTMKTFNVETMIHIVSS